MQCVNHNHTRKEKKKSSFFSSCFVHKIRYPIINSFFTQESVCRVGPIVQVTLQKKSSKVLKLLFFQNFLERKRKYRLSVQSGNISQYIILKDGILRFNSFSITSKQAVYLTVHSLGSKRTNCQ